MNVYAILVAALVPMLIGFIYYNPKVVGGVWMKEAGLKQEDLEKSNMAIVMGASLLFSVMLSFSMPFTVIHQAHLESIVANQLKDPTSAAGIEATAMVKSVMDKYGNEFRTFKHGVLHGVLTALFFALPIIGMNSLFERRSFKYIFIHLGYWVIVIGLMGGIVSAWK
jgi:hypothetical protein